MTKDVIANFSGSYCGGTKLFGESNEGWF